MLVSIIVPVYNTIDYIDQCIRSIICQSVEDWECILIDDGSSDGVSQRCDEWVKKDCRIKVIHQKNAGVSIARNEGIKVAKGDFLYFLDSDDWCEPYIFEHIENVDMLVGGYLMGHTPVVSTIVETTNYPLAYLCESVRTCIGAFVVKTSIVVENGIFFEPKRKYAEDLSFILRCLMYSTSIKVMKSIFVYYRQNDNSAMHTYDLNRFESYFSRLWLLNNVLSLRNKEVVLYLQNFSCVEAVVIATKDLFRYGYSVKALKAFYKQHPSIYITLIRAMKNSSLPFCYGNAARLLVYCPYMYKLYVVLMYKWYDLHALLGRLKQKVFGL